MTTLEQWELYMDINRKACDMINGEHVEFSEKELYQIAYTFGGEATILRRKMNGSEHGSNS